jgi:Flp pilus assembly protein TadD
VCLRITIIGLVLLPYTECSGTGSEDDPNWRVQMERGKERAKRRDWDGAIREFTEAIRLAPHESAPRVERGNAQGESGRFAEARADFARGVEVDPDNPEPRFRLALACIAEGDDAGYRRACAELVALYAASEDPKVTSPLTYTCVARPMAVDKPEVVVRWGERAVSLFRGNERVLGAALYRNGQFADAVRKLDESARLTTPVGWDWLFLAMSHHQLGHAPEARTNLAKAHRWIVAAEAARNDKPVVGASRTSWHSWNERAEVRALLREAESLLGASDSRSREEE